MTSDTRIQVQIGKRCGAQYERPGGRERGDRIVECDLPARHATAHRETATGNWWPQGAPQVDYWERTSHREPRPALLTDEQVDAAIKGMTAEELRIAFKFLHGYTERLRGDGASRAVALIEHRRQAMGGRGFSGDRVIIDETDRIRRAPARKYDDATKCCNGTGLADHAAVPCPNPECSAVSS